MGHLIKRIGDNNEFLSLSGNIIYTILGFASFVFLTRTYSADVFGSWVLYVTAASFIEMIRFGITKYAIIKQLSGAGKIQRRTLLGSHWFISLVVTIIIVLIVVFLRFQFPATINNSGYEFFFKWYPLLAIANLPFNNSLSILQADEKFGKILFLKGINIAAFVLFLGLNRYLWKTSVDVVILVHLGINLISSLACMSFGWDGIRDIFHAKRESMKRIIDFGKYTTGTALGMNLLKSTDVIIIGLSPVLGTAGVAFYSIPLKLIELLEIPLRSFAATSFPRMSKAANRHDYAGVRNLFYSYSGILTIVFIPLCVTGILFSKTLTVWLAGNEYIEAAILVNVFMISSLLLPLDRFTGICLDSINRPDKNFYKVMIQNIVSIAGAVTVLLLFTYIIPDEPSVNILMYFSLISLLTTFTGLLSGMLFLSSDIKINPSDIIRKGLKDIKDSIFKS